MGEKKVDIAIIGAGMVGCSLAVSLKDSGYSVALIDAQTPESLIRSLPNADSVSTFEPRVSATDLCFSRFAERMWRMGSHSFDEKAAVSKDACVG